MHIVDAHNVAVHVMDLHSMGMNCPDMQSVPTMAMHMTGFSLAVKKCIVCQDKNLLLNNFMEIRQYLPNKNFKNYLDNTSLVKGNAIE